MSDQKNIQGKWLFRALKQYGVLTVTEDSMKREVFHDGQDAIVTEHKIVAFYSSPDSESGVVITEAPDFPGKFNAFPWFELSENKVYWQLDNFQFDSIEAAQTPEKANRMHAIPYVPYNEKFAIPIVALEDDVLDSVFEHIKNIVKDPEKRKTLGPAPKSQEEFQSALQNAFLKTLQEQHDYDENAAGLALRATAMKKGPRFGAFAMEVIALVKAEG